MDAGSFLERADGSQIAYRHIAGDSPGILFCPGFNSDMQGTKALALDAWCRQQGRQFTCFDYYAHGQSSGESGQGCIGRWRDDALAILDEVTSGPQLIVGSSMGGWIMLLVASARPQRIAALLGVAAAPDFTERLRDSGLDSTQLQQLAEIGYCDMPNDYDDGQPYRISRYLLEEGREHLLLDQEIAIDVPVRLIHGQCDEDVPWQHSLAVAEHLRASDVEVLLVKSGDHRLSGDGDIQRLLCTLSALLADMEDR